MTSQLDTYMNKDDLLFKRDFLPQCLHSLVQCYCSARAVQSPGSIDQVVIKSRSNLGCNVIINRPHRIYHTAKSRELHRRSQMDRLIRTRLIADGGVASRQKCKLGILPLRSDDLPDR